ncbi:flagellar hook-length control protein FliK [Pseudomonas quasicaspiana]|uniref:flagellar hook-length control protein FliK n=1 Tax=Pseudomonas quasicaspiana TaxID=2829821 RepID=UPI001E414FCD|nr:flagellar hook-length control protein FliK [Pseudomonas quasicaspiana]MCD5979272.1 flagellar hook-length control protein FliK [Pseudomonas quasicaspiana]
MPLAPNALLQATPVAAQKASSASNSARQADSSKDDNSSFSDVYAKQAQAKSAASNDAPVKARSAADKDKQVADKAASDKNDAAASDSTTVADSGNTLPAEPVASADDGKADEEVDPALAQVVTPDPALDPSLDPALQAIVSQASTQVDVDKPKVDVASASSALAVQAADPTEASFDPSADPLEDMPALQFALENAAAKAQQAQQAQNAHATAQTGKNAKLDNAATDPSQLANNLAALDERPSVSDEPSTESSDKSFDGLLDSGLKDVKAAAGDTRVDNFADRLAALSQAAQQPRVAAPAVPLMNQPLAMHQSGWSEGVVERVMYLSSQNLKSADIQLEPAELGRLDIRINMAPDQQTQVTFMSGHAGVREALESQMSRLRDSFTQQGMGQVDVNVSDQSRNQQNQAQQQEQANNARGTGNGGSGVNGVDGSVDGIDADTGVAISQPVQRVVGTSEIDFYA